jgi:uncharacterized membrane protein
MMRGQTLVEFAFVLPLLLVLILVAVDLGRIQRIQYELNHAASEGAIAGAALPNGGCPTAEATAARILGRGLGSPTCVVRAGMVELTLSEAIPILEPLLPDPFTINVTARAALR